MAPQKLSESRCSCLSAKFFAPCCKKLWHKIRRKVFGLPPAMSMSRHKVGQNSRSCNATSTTDRVPAPLGKQAPLLLITLPSRRAEIVAADLACARCSCTDVFCEHSPPLSHAPRASQSHHSQSQLTTALFTIVSHASRPQASCVGIFPATNWKIPTQTQMACQTHALHWHATASSHPLLPPTPPFPSRHTRWLLHGSSS